jgi:glycosyltransferase involved in cell wall biosynthesis
LVEDRGRGVAAFKRWLGARVRELGTARTIAVSEAQREWYVATFPVDPSRVMTIHNGVLDPERTTEPMCATGERLRLGLSDDVVVAANVALMRPGKGHNDLLEAVRLLPRDSNLRVLLIGDGPERSALQRELESDPNIRDRVLFLGYRDDVPRLLAEVDLVVHPTHADALPTALIHALSRGIPVVATDVGGIPEIIGDDAGVLVPVCDPPRLSAVLQELATNPVRRATLGDAARRRFETGFDAKIWAECLGQVYRGTATAPEPRSRA